MAGVLASRAPSRPFAVSVRIVAFLVGLASILTIPTVFVEASLGHLTLTGSLIAAAVAAGLLVVAALAARSVDPLRA
jgi:hypothetical protein